MKGEVADAVLEAVRSAHDGVSVSEVPGYIVIEVPDRIDVSADAVRDQLGRLDWVMTDLNEVMPAFAGHIEIFTEDRFVLARPDKLARPEK
jgi:hypothetical protein